jgi:stage II sporulation protein D
MKIFFHFFILTMVLASQNFSFAAERDLPACRQALRSRGGASLLRRSSRFGCEGWKAPCCTTERTIRVQDKKSGMVSTYPVEDYVASVLASEMPAEFPPEALKAQAVVIRTLTMNPPQDHRLQGFDFCDTTHCQLFRPFHSVPEKFRVAARQTRGQYLSYDHRPIVALYHSACGGHTSANQRVFGGEPQPYLQGVDDKNYCQASPQNIWKSSLPRQALEGALNFSPLQQIQILDGEAAGRNFTLGLEGRDFKKISAQDFLLQVGQRLGWEKIKSAYFVVAPDPQVGEIKFIGHGLGHGVGLCQWGARGMALKGKTYPQILQHYFPGTQLDEK